MSFDRRSKRDIRVDVFFIVIFAIGLENTYSVEIGRHLAVCSRISLAFSLRALSLYALFIYIPDSTHT